jgi:hypothetical protein
MLKARHIIATSIVLGLAAMLVIGGVGRTQAKTSIVNESYSQSTGNGNGNNGSGYDTVDHDEQTTYGVPLVLAEEQFTETETLTGTVQSYDEYELWVNTDQGNILIDGRSLSFALEAGFTANVSDSVSLYGFYEDGDFEVIRINNLTTGQTTTLRDESGRPGWSSGGNGGGGGRRVAE